MPVRPHLCCSLPAAAERGYVLFDVLIAHLLLALSLLGGGLALVQAIAASRAAALQGAAVDLLADLGESLHISPQPAGVIEAWPARAAQQLPAGHGVLALPGEPAGPDPVQASLRWREPAQPQFTGMRISIVPPAPADAP